MDEGSLSNVIDEKSDTSSAIESSAPMVTMETDARSLWRRSLAAASILLSAFIYFATYDMPGSLERTIEQEFDIETYQFEYLYTFYAIPPIFICLIGGVLLDEVFGLYRGLIFVVTVALVGEIIQTAAGFLRIYWLFVLGRFVYGAGTELMVTALNCVIVIWFKGKEISLVFAMFQSFIRVGTSFAFYVAEPLFESLSDIESRKRYAFGSTLLLFLALVVVQLINAVHLSLFTRNNLPQAAKTKNGSERVKLTDIVKLPVRYWLLVFMFCVSTCTIYALVSLMQHLLEKQYGMSLEETIHMGTFFNLFTSIIIPFLGLLINYVGYELSFNIAGTVLGVVSMCIMVGTTWTPYVPLIVYSVGVTLVNICGMPLIALSVDEKLVSTAYGVLQSVLNATSASLQLAAGYILSTAGPEPVAMFFMACMAFGFVCCAILCVLDRKNNGVLNASRKQRNRILQMN